MLFGANQIVIPLTAVLPEALPSCFVLVAPDSVELAVAGSGALATSLPIPQQPSLVGLTLHHQVLVLRPAAAGAAGSAFATNRLTLTVGSL